MHFDWFAAATRLTGAAQAAHFDAGSRCGTPADEAFTVLNEG
jgi:hypothetical protein